MHPSLDHELAARELQRRLAQELHRHELAARARDRAPRPTAGHAVLRRASAVRAVQAVLAVPGRAVRATRRPTAPAGAPAQRPAAIARPAADGHALAA